MDVAQVQVRLPSILDALERCASLIESLSVLSANETLDDLSTNTLPCLYVPFLQGLCSLQKRATGRMERKTVLRESFDYLRPYLRSLEDYGILDKGWSIVQEPKDPARRREAKIAAFKAEKELKSNIERLKSELTTDEDERARAQWLARLRLGAWQARASILISKQELDIMIEAPPSPDPAEAGKKPVEEDTTWRLDNLNLNREATSGPLLDQAGKPLRPFTILPSRQDVKVFGPSHRLPTMSVDEFLEAEASRMITGGGQAGADRDLEQKEQQISRLEGDNLEAEQVEATNRAEKQRWDAYLDDHRRGEGNRFRRG